jgi:Mn2+/Fe2+ NRAMP family transporter
VATTEAPPTEKVVEDARILRSVEGAPLGKRLRTYLGLGGPGWLQSALTLGGGSLTGSLYLGVLAGFSMLWLQPVAMLLGIVMLSALGYVTVTTGERPFVAIHRHINPVLAWGWAAASLISSMVWAMPQYALANAAMQQNLLPGVLGPDSALGQFNSTLLVSLAVLIIATMITWNYGSDTVGVRFFEGTLKVMVGLIVLAFLGVALRLSFAPGGLDLAAIGRGFVPNPLLILRPADGFTPLLVGLPAEFQSYWSALIVERQQQVMAAAFSTAVGINMTFLFGYSLLRRRWGPEFRGFMKFDLGTGMLIPFMIATSCIMIAAGNQFHGVAPPGFSDDPAVAAQAPPSARQLGEYRSLLVDRLSAEHGDAVRTADPGELDRQIAAMDPQDRQMAAVLVTRDAFDLAQSLRPITGDFFSGIVFGLGVLGMALSTITLLMVVSGLVVCEVLNRPHTGWPFRMGAMLAGVGILGPFFWSQAYFWLAVPTSIIGLMLLPIAYVTFFLMMNRRSLLGASMPVGRRRVVWNTLMGIALVVVITASLNMIWRTAGVGGMLALAGFLGAVGVAEVFRLTRPHRESE